MGPRVRFNANSFVGGSTIVGYCLHACMQIDLSRARRWARRALLRWLRSSRVRHTLGVTAQPACLLTARLRVRGTQRWEQAVAPRVMVGVLSTSQGRWLCWPCWHISRDGE